MLEEPPFMVRREHWLAVADLAREADSTGFVEPLN
jgi:hypothetical protein